ncbi:MAG: 23S rRNA (adenine(2503)-C(2))-methyltransferase RlmN [Chlamydiota bacterium]
MHNSKIPILSHSQQSYSQAIYAMLGKGKLHAAKAYSEFFRRGAILGEDPSFTPTTGDLLKAIIDNTEVSALDYYDHFEEEGTVKFIFQTYDKHDIETVVVPMQDGATLCISSQAGCRRKCAFCETGKLGLLRSLSVQEIVGQVFEACIVRGYHVRNIVFMGMGEPFDNYDNVLAAAKVIFDPGGLGFGPARVTVSTCGVVSGIERLSAEKGPVPNLAVSLNAPSDGQRRKMMPITKEYDLSALYRAMQRYNHLKGKQILVGYVLIDGFNDSVADACRLGDYLQGLDVKVNIIPYNQQSRTSWRPSSACKMEAFVKELRSQGYRVLVRQSKGQKIMAACGQLGCHRK